MMHRTAALLLGLALIAPGTAYAGINPEQWLQQFRHQPMQPVPGGSSMICGPQSTEIVVDAPAALVRVSLELPFQAFLADQFVQVLDEQGELLPVDVRPLSFHRSDPPSVRRAIVTFGPREAQSGPVSYSLYASPLPPEQPANAGRVEDTFRVGPLSVTVGPGGGLRVESDSGTVLSANPIAPDTGTAPVIEVIEHGNHYLWLRALLPDPVWPRIVEVRADATGHVEAIAHLQQTQEDYGYAPEFGWRLDAPHHVEPSTLEIGPDTTAEALAALGGGFDLGFAAKYQKGSVAVDATGMTYLRARPQDKVPHQKYAWRQAAFAFNFTEGAGTTSPRGYSRPWYNPRTSKTHKSPWLKDIYQHHVELIASSPKLGDDWGNITSMPASGVFGMNRLNHNAPIFDAYRRSGNMRLRNAAVGWCDNFYDLSIWWGNDREGEFGGTRYNNVAAMGGGFAQDPEFMWRSNSAVHFCTKGYDSFLYAYEETGDPRFLTALRHQADYAGRMVHTDQGEARNIGDVRDFVRLYDHLGDPVNLEHGLRLFRELRTKLSDGDLFSQGGQPIVPNPPFIDTDEDGYAHPFVKPYIIGYALAGLPDLATYAPLENAPEDPKLRDVIRAVADFLAETVDPVGGWRYPHPQSSRVIIGQGMEHAAQLCRAANYLKSPREDVENLLDAIEIVLQARVGGFLRNGAILEGLSGWEHNPGELKEGEKLRDRYASPDDRDPARDYAEGAIASGGTSPEGAVYFFEVMDFYLAHRSAERLKDATPQLNQVLDRLAPPANATYLDYGMEKKLPHFAAQRIEAMTFPLAREHKLDVPFDTWRADARQSLLDALQSPPPQADFDPVLLAEEQREGYTAQKWVFNVSGFSRVPAYLLVPDGTGPFPAVVALHDHGAHFSIGKEKVVRPFGVEQAVADDALDWVGKSYGGRFFGDELAKRGFVVLAVDALFWGERGRKEGVDYEAQQELGANLLQLGMCWPGVITWDDVRSAEFLATMPAVDPERIGAMGLSMGSHRTWMLAAATDRIKAGAAICWMGDTAALMAPGNNQTTGQSSFSMIVPGLRNRLDYPDVASIACPKPMLFYNGTQDALFPVDGVERSYAKMRAVWEAEDHGDELETRLWEVPHEFNAAMQDDAFDWLELQLR